MDPLTIAAIGAPIISGIMGNNAASKDREQAARFREQALAQFAGIDIPDEEKQKLLLEQYSNAGLLTPELEQLITLGSTAQEGISLDPSMRQKQLESLAGMGEYATQGVTAADQAGYELARRNSAAEANAQTQGILANMQSRGMGGSGAELIARLQTQQSAADRLQQAQLMEAQKKQAARMQALEQQSSMASGLRNQDYGEQSNLANARDAVMKFNAANSQQVAHNNVAAQNQAKQYNVSNQQRVADNNVGVKNQQQQHNKGLGQQTFNNQLNLANAKAGQFNNSAQASTNQAANTAAGYANIGQGVGTILTGLNQNNKPNNTQSLANEEFDKWKKYE